MKKCILLLVTLLSFLKVGAAPPLYGVRQFISMDLQDTILLNFPSGAISGMDSIEVAGVWYSSFSGGGSVDYGTEGQLPVVNSTGDGFNYSPLYKWDGIRLILEEPGDSEIGNLFIGLNSGSSGQGQINIGIGENSLNSLNSLNSDVLSNIAIGYNAGTSIETGSYNTILGSVAGSSLPINATSNTLIGHGAGQLIGDQNVVIGRQGGATATGDGNVFIGYQSGYSYLGDNKLIVENSDDVTTPLIFGDFVNNIVKINDTLEATVVQTDTLFMNGTPLGLSDVTGGGSDNQQISFTTSIPFNYTNTGVTLHALTQNETFTINTTGAFTGAETYYEIQSNDTYTIDTDVCTNIGTKSFSTDADTVNVLKFEYVNSRCLLTILDKYYTAPLVAGYYVDSEAGDDNNDGTSELEAVQTLAKITELVALDETPTIYLKRGSVFEEEVLLIPDSSYITVYGTGDKPTIRGGRTLDNANFSLTSGQTYTYEMIINDLPRIENTYANIDTLGVLMTWEDSVRLGGAFEDNQTSIAGVESNAGSYWFDAASETLYIHPSDDSNPVTNGKFYEASTKTLTVHGGNSYYIEYVNTDLMYAFNSNGQQGYGLLGYKSGHFYRCRSTRGWNHLIGVANSDAADTLLYEECYAYDCEEITSLAASLYVAYKGDQATAKSKVIFRNCVAKQPNDYTTIQTAGILSHGDSIDVYYDGFKAENCYYGMIISHEPEASATWVSDNESVFKKCQTGINPSSYIAEKFNNIVADSCFYSINIGTNARIDSLYDITSINCRKLYANNTDTTNVSNCIFAYNPPLTSQSSIALDHISTGRFELSSNSFYECGSAFGGDIVTSDYNNFYSCVAISVNNTDWAPGYWYTLSNWQTASSQDANSTQTDPGYSGDFWDVIIEDPTE